MNEYEPLRQFVELARDLHFGRAARACHVSPSALSRSVQAQAGHRSIESTRREAHARMLGNGLCTRPVELECRMECTCETCAYVQTGPQFVPIILRQRDHAHDHNQPDREALFEGLLDRIAGNSA
jgi:hypothetical protein